LSVGLFRKAAILWKAIKIIKNWPIFIKLYFHKIKSEYVILETRKGIKIKLRVDSTDLMAFTNVWLVEEYQKTDSCIKNDDTIIDIGAHIGLFALYASQFCKAGKIFCFEPIKENFDMLISNIELNGITNVFATNTAVSADNNTVTIYLNEDQAGHSMHHVSPKKIQTKSVSLKNIFDSNAIEKCDFLKMDCEGEEYSIMSALPDSYYSRIRKIFMEYHLADTRPQLLQNLISKLQTFAFKIVQTETTSSMGLLYASK
jgi:FkbM family methyltransferase